MEHIYDVAVIGGGIAGYSAALSLKSLGLDYLWLGEELFGEKVKKSEYVRNFPSFVGNGQQFSEALTGQKEREGIAFTKGRADGIFRMKGGFTISAVPALYSARTVILCTGVDFRGGLKGEREFLGRGVSYCAVCDGALYRGKRIAAVLSDLALADDVAFLSNFAAEVLLFSASDVTFEQKNIHICREIPRSIEGNARVERLVTDTDSHPVDGVFLLRKALPPAALCGGLETDGAHIVVKRDLSTNLEGLFAAGDVTGLPYQYAKAAGEGLVAAHSVKRYLALLS